MLQQHGRLLTCGKDTYYIAFPNDRWLAKLLVYGIFVCEAVQTLIISHDTFQVFVVNFGDLHSMDLMHTNWFSIPIAGGISASLSLFLPLLLLSFPFSGVHWATILRVSDKYDFGDTYSADNYHHCAFPSLRLIINNLGSLTVRAALRGFRSVGAHSWSAVLSSSEL